MENRRQGVSSIALCYGGYDLETIFNAAFARRDWCQRLLNTISALSARSDDELMLGILAAEQTAFNELYSRHHLLLRKIIGQVLPADTDVEETVQDVFMEIWNRAANFDSVKGKALGWIICMARRRAVDRLRRVIRHTETRATFRELEEANKALFPSEPGYVSGEAGLATRDLRRALDGMIEFLPSEQQAVIQFIFFQEMSQRQVAARTGIPLGTIKTRLELAIRKLSRWSEHLRNDLDQFA